MPVFESKNATFTYKSVVWSGIASITFPVPQVVMRSANVLGDTVRKMQPAPLGSLQPFTIEMREVTTDAKAVKQSLYGHLNGTAVTASLAELFLDQYGSVTCSAYPSDILEFTSDKDDDDPVLMSIKFQPADSGSFNV